jgi:hypothetical protein
MTLNFEINQKNIENLKLLRLVDPKNSSSLENIINKAIKDYVESEIDQNQLQTYSKISKLDATNLLNNYSKYLNRLTKLKTFSRPYIDKGKNYKVAHKFPSDFLVLKSRDYITFRSLQILIENTSDKPLSFDLFKKLAVEDALNLRKEAEIIDYFSMKFDTKGKREKYAIKRSIGLPNDNKGSIGKYIRSYIGYQPDKNYMTLKGPIFEMQLVNLYLVDKEIHIGISESGYRLYSELADAGFSIDYPHNLKAATAFLSYLSKLQNDQHLTFSQMLTSINELFFEPKNILRDSFWLEISSFYKFDKGSVRNLLSDNTRTISFSNILGNLEEWGLVKIKNLEVTYQEWFWNSIQVEDTNQDTLFYNFIHDNFIHAKISGQILDFTNRGDSLLHKSIKKSTKTGTFYEIFDYWYDYKSENKND